MKVSLDSKEIVDIFVFHGLYNIITIEPCKEVMQVILKPHLVILILIPCCLVPHFMGHICSREAAEKRRVWRRRAAEEAAEEATATAAAAAAVDNRATIDWGRATKLEEAAEEAAADAAAAVRRQELLRAIWEWEDARAVVREADRAARAERRRRWAERVAAGGG